MIAKELEHIDKLNFAEEKVAGREYEGVRFVACNFARANLSCCVFWDCIFEDCDLSLAEVAGTAFRGVVFEGCKMLGFRGDKCNQLGLEFSFNKCNLDHSCFSGMKIPKTSFSDSTLREVDFEGSDLSGSSFSGCNLARTLFAKSNLKKADFRTAEGFSIDPDSNKLSGAKFSTDGLAGLLDKYKLDIYP